MKRLLPAFSLVVLLAVAQATWAESVAVGAITTPAATATTATSATAASLTGTVMISSPGTTSTLSGHGSSVSISSGSPVVLPSGTYTLGGVNYVQGVNKGAATEKWELIGSGYRPQPIRVVVTGGEVTTLAMGPPLVAAVKIGKAREVAEPATDGPAGRFIPVNLELQGQAGELYRTIAHENKMAEVPTFTFLDEKGNEIGQGKAQYG